MVVKEADLRKWHRRIGIVLAVFIAIQVGSGLWLSARSIVHPHGEGTSKEHAADEAHSSSLAQLHHGGGVLGTAYRVFVGVGTLWMVGTGTMIYFRVQRRTRKK